DTGALNDPLVARVHDTAEVVIGVGAARKVPAASDDAKPEHLTLVWEILESRRRHLSYRRWPALSNRIPTETLLPESVVGNRLDLFVAVVIHGVQIVFDPHSGLARKHIQNVDFRRRAVCALYGDCGVDPTQGARQDEQINHDVRQTLGGELLADD